MLSLGYHRRIWFHSNRLFSKLPALDEPRKLKHRERHENPYNLPNAITMGRILATPYLAHVIVSGDYKFAAGLLTVAGISDWLDGYIAKKYNAQSVVGSFLDPMADKIMISMLSVTLAYQGLLPLSLVSIMFGRDFMLVGGTLYHRYKFKNPKDAFFSTTDVASFEVTPSLVSKVNTVLQFSTMGLCLVNAAWSIPGDTIMNTLYFTTGMTTIASGTDYVLQYGNKTGALGSVFKNNK